MSPSIPIDVPTGTALQGEGSVPTLFTPIRIRGLELQSRLVLSPMGTWSAEDGHLTEFHLVHYGEFAIRGVALVVIEATAVSANGRTSPQDSGLWKDSQAAALKRVVDFIHAQGQKAGIQLCHAGRKASMIAPRLSPGGSLTAATERDGGWPEDVWAPSVIPHSEPYITPKALTVGHINDLTQSFADAARRAVQAGVDFIEIHGAHGYLIHQFLSPLTNERVDGYGGSFENRTRLLRRVIEAVRKAIPDSMPLSLRISATEWMEWSGRPTWDLEQSIRLAKLLPGLGVDVLDVSSGGNLVEQKIEIRPRYQIDFASAIRRILQTEGVSLLVAAVGLITSPEIASSIVQATGSGKTGDSPETRSDHSGGPVEAEDLGSPDADLVFVGRQFLREPSFVLRCARKLDVNVRWPFQYERAKTRT